MEAKARNCLARGEKKLILANHGEGKSYSEIAGIVRRSKSIGYRAISRFEADKTLQPKLRTGRPQMTTKRKNRMIVKMSLKDRFDTATSIFSISRQIVKRISEKTVSWRLNNEKFAAWIVKKNQIFRLDFAIEHIL